MRRLPHILILAAFLFSSGGQWYFLQGVAWVEMIQHFNQYYSFTESVEMTLSGHYPCALCKAIAEHKQADNMKLVSFEKYKKVCIFSVYSPPCFQTFVSARPRYLPFLSPAVVTLAFEPITPPPRVA